MSISSYHHIICELLHPIINKGAGQIRTAWHFFRTAPCPAVNVWCARPVMIKIVAQPNWDYVIACRTRQRNLAPPMLSHSCGFGLVSGRLIVPGIVFLAPCPQPSQIPQQVCVGRVQYHGLFIVAPSFISRARHHPKVSAHVATLACTTVTHLLRACRALPVLYPSSPWFSATTPCVCRYQALGLAQMRPPFVPLPCRRRHPG